MDQYCATGHCDALQRRVGSVLVVSGVVVRISSCSTRGHQCSRPYSCAEGWVSMEPIEPGDQLATPIIQAGTNQLAILEDEQNLYDWGIENRLGKRLVGSLRVGIVKSLCIGRDIAPLCVGVDIARVLSF